MAIDSSRVRGPVWWGPYQVSRFAWTGEGNFLGGLQLPAEGPEDSGSEGFGHGLLHTPLEQGHGMADILRPCRSYLEDGGPLLRLDLGHHPGPTIPRVEDFN